MIITHDFSRWFITYGVRVQHHGVLDGRLHSEIKIIIANLANPMLINEDLPVMLRSIRKAYVKEYEHTTAHRHLRVGRSYVVRLRSARNIDGSVYKRA
jgi:hypothetical protein